MSLPTHKTIESLTDICSHLTAVYGDAEADTIAKVQAVIETIRPPTTIPEAARLSNEWHTASHELLIAQLQAVSDKHGVLIATGHMSDTLQTDISGNPPHGNYPREWIATWDTNLHYKHPACIEVEVLSQAAIDCDIGISNNWIAYPKEPTSQHQGHQRSLYLFHVYAAMHDIEFTSQELYDTSITKWCEGLNLRSPEARALADMEVQAGYTKAIKRAQKALTKGDHNNLLTELMLVASLEACHVHADSPEYTQPSSTKVELLLQKLHEWITEMWEIRDDEAMG